ncbi:MAG TPA: GYD domain-containing protein [Hanamia sp.]|nr:GYD domain-containing protein [Hanamia sp.]
MTKYLIKASYNSEGVKGLLKSGGTSRKRAIDKMVKDLGGKLEVFYYAFGDHDVYAICSLPDTATAAAIVLTINASGLVSISTTVLVDPEEIDKAKDISVTYRTPGK